MLLEHLLFNSLFLLSTAQIQELVYFLLAKHTGDNKMQRRLVPYPVVVVAIFAVFFQVIAFVLPKDLT